MQVESVATTTIEYGRAELLVKIRYYLKYEYKTSWKQGVFISVRPAWERPSRLEYKGNSEIFDAWIHGKIRTFCHDAYVQSAVFYDMYIQKYRCSGLCAIGNVKNMDIEFIYLWSI